jgi:hypothetical protein
MDLTLSSPRNSIVLYNLTRFFELKNGEYRDGIKSKDAKKGMNGPCIRHNRPKRNRVLPRIL